MTFHEPKLTQGKGTITTIGVTGPERCPNTGFETDISGWESNTAFGAYAAATLSRSSTRAHSGSWSLLATWPNGGAAGSWANFGYATTPDVAYNFSGWVWVPSGHDDVRPVVVFLGNGSTITTKNAWVQFQWSFVATGDFHFIGVETTTAAESGEQMWLDDVSLKRAAPPYALIMDGATTACPAMGLDKGNYGYGQRVTVGCRNPLPPIIQGSES